MVDLFYIIRARTLAALAVSVQIIRRGHGTKI
nr:MAG TPA: hypothetical protein [Caudoviricetes sp.]